MEPLPGRTLLTGERAASVAGRARTVRVVIGRIGSQRCILKREGRDPLEPGCVPVIESEQSVPKPEYEFHTPTGEWLPASGPAAGIWQQVLSLDPETGSYTGLTRYEAGTDTSPDGPAVHDYWEEVFILEGDLTDLRLGQTFRQGMYACRPPGMVHGPWRSEAGVLMLEIRYPPESLSS